MAETAELKAIIKAEVDQAVTAFKKFDDQVKKTGKSINTGSAAATDFTRVIQDAPFGIIGIGNNLQQLAQSFGTLKQSTGSAGGAFKALAGSLVGPGGIAFAITAITTALSFAQVGLQNWTRKTQEAKEKQDEWAKQQHGVAVSIEKQRIEIAQLVKVASGDVGTKKEQIAALEKLNAIIPDNIGVLTQQNIKHEQGVEIIKRYIKALEAQATAELLMGRLAEINVKILDARNKKEKDLLDLAASRPKKLRGGIFGQIQQETREIKKNDIVDTFEQTRLDLTAEAVKLRNEIERIFPTGSILGGDKKKETTPEKEIKDLDIKAKQTIPTLIGLQTILKDMMNPVAAGPKLGLQIISPEVLARAKEAQALFNEQQSQLRAISNVLSGELASAFSTVFDSAMKGEDVFKALTQAVKQLVLNLVKAVAQALILEAIASAFGLKGGGTFLSGIFSGGMALSGVNSSVGAQPAMVAVGTLRGQDILLSVQRTERTNFING